MDGMLVHRRVTPQYQVCGYPFDHMGKERDRESKVSCPRTQQNVLGSLTRTQTARSGVECAYYEATTPPLTSV